jgi:hypothetical protein
MPHAPFLDMAESMFTLSDLLRDPALAARVGAEYQQADKAVRNRRASRAARVAHRRQQPPRTNEPRTTELDRARAQVAALRSSSPAPISDLQAARQELQRLGWSG